jgi:transcription antitermination factor NusG
MTQHWYVVHSKPRKEDFLADQMMSRRLVVFNPILKTQRVNPRARKTKPYFPGYLFAKMDLEDSGAHAVRFIPGAADLVCFGGEPAHVPEGLIQAIRQKVDDINAAGGELLKILLPGGKVHIHSGPFAGYEGIFDSRLPGQDRVRVLLRLIQARQVPVDLPAGYIQAKKSSLH